MGQKTRDKILLFGGKVLLIADKQGIYKEILKTAEENIKYSLQKVTHKKELVSFIF